MPEVTHWRGHVQSSGLNRGAFFARMGRAYAEPGVAHFMQHVIDQVLPFVREAGFTVVGNTAFVQKMGSSFAIKEASVMLRDPAQAGSDSNPESNASDFALMVRIVTRHDMAGRPDVDDLTLDVGARRVGGQERAGLLRPFALTKLAGLHVDWHQAPLPFADALVEALHIFNSKSADDSSMAAGAKAFTAALVDQLAP
jgi:hypothetical protein